MSEFENARAAENTQSNPDQPVFSPDGIRFDLDSLDALVDASGATADPPANHPFYHEVAQCQPPTLTS